MTDAVFTAGAPAPQVFGVVILDGRLGIVLQRFDGPTLLQLTRSGGVTRGQAGAILADLFRAVHSTPPRRACPTCAAGWMPGWGPPPARFRRPSPPAASSLWSSACSRPTSSAMATFTPAT